MRLLEAAQQVLEQHGGPLHYRQITQFAIAEGLISPRGLTPEASMNAAFSTAITRTSQAGHEPTFGAHGRGFYSLLKAKVGSAVEEAVQRNNIEVRERLHTQLREMHPRAFEELIGRLLEALGFEDVEVTNYSGDKGIDVRGTLSVGGVTHVNTAIQVKRLTGSSVSAAIVQQLRGGLSPHERGLIITVGKFSRDALAEASMQDRTPISLVDGDRLVDLLIENQIGVVTTPLRLLRLDVASLLPTDDAQGPESDDELIAQAGPSAMVVLPTTRARRPARRPDGKLFSLWPMPGGKGTFVDTLTTMLGNISENEPSVDEFIGWILDTFPTVKSRNTAIGYLNVPRFAGLAELRADRLTVTGDAAAYLLSGARDDLLRIMSSLIAGLEETLELIRHGPRTSVQVTAKLNELLGTAWETDAQARWRLMWLESFGKVAQKADSWLAVEETNGHDRVERTENKIVTSASNGSVGPGAFPHGEVG